jgi:hypothetical protein
VIDELDVHQAGDPIHPHVEWADRLRCNEFAGCRYGYGAGHLREDDLAAGGVLIELAHGDDDVSSHGLSIYRTTGRH